MKSIFLLLCTILCIGCYSGDNVNIVNGNDKDKDPVAYEKSQQIYNYFYHELVTDIPRTRWIGFDKYKNPTVFLLNENINNITTNSLIIFTDDKGYTTLRNNKFFKKSFYINDMASISSNINYLVPRPSPIEEYGPQLGIGIIGMAILSGIPVVLGSMLIFWFIWSICHAPGKLKARNERIKAEKDWKALHPDNRSLKEKMMDESD
jgi:hypothetical protein